jgi:hypothetical protein
MSRYKKQGKSEKLSQPKGAQEDMTTKFDVLLGMASYNCKKNIR